MKKILVSAIIAVLAVGLSSCSKDSLNTAPTDAITGENMFSSATNALQLSMESTGCCTLPGRQDQAPRIRVSVLCLII